MIELILTIDKIYIDVNIQNDIERNIIILYITNNLDNCKFQVDMINNKIIVEKDEYNEIYQEISHIFDYISKTNEFYLRKKS